MTTVAVIEECEACLTPDACQIRGTCAHYSREQIAVAKPVPTTPAPDALPDLPDAIRVPIHRIWADAGYLVGRAIAGDKDLAVHTIKALCDEAERAIRAALASQAEKHAAELAKLRQWRDTVDDMLTVCHEVASDDPRESIDRLINWHVQVALDPAVSSDAAALVEVGRQQGAQPPREALQPLSDEISTAGPEQNDLNGAIERLITERMSAAKETK